MSLVGDLSDPAGDSLRRILDWKYGPAGKRGWGPTLRAKFNYVTPDDLYETLVYDTVTEQTKWLDVGCGRDIFPSNRHTARVLSDRCELLVGVDPDDNIDDNEFVHRKEKTPLEGYSTDCRFDLITLRMVVEHVADPPAVVDRLAELAAPGGQVVVYTVSKWSPVSLLARLTPTFVHKIGKSVLWQAEDRDTFPVRYRMNTRRDLDRQFRAAGFTPVSFRYVDDCRVFQRWRFSNYMELSLRRLIRGIGAEYPESCILAVYKKS